MADSFGTVLAGIIEQKSDLETAPERAIEIFVVLPLLRSVGWNTGNASETYPQRALPEGGIVDYDLKIDSVSQVVIEVKRWGHILNSEDEAQLANYCRVAEPKVALLTSGRVWRLYLPPTRRSTLREFLEVDITRAESTKLERIFSQFISRESMVSSGPTLTAARKLHSERQAYQNFRRDVTAEWNKLANDEDGLIELTMDFSEKRGIPASRENVQRFISSLHGSLVNEVPSRSRSQRMPPSSFALPTSPTGNSGNRKLKGPKGWNNFLAELCTLMYERHAESFRQNMLPIGLFSGTEDSTFDKPMGSSGVYARYGNSNEIRETCYEVVVSFGYSKESLVIKDSKGAVL